MKAVVQIGVGEPGSSLALREIPAPGAPGDDEVIVDVDLASVHHGDLFMTRKVTSIPAQHGYVIRGNEAVSRISAIGKTAAGGGRVMVGDRVPTNLAPAECAQCELCTAWRDRHVRG